VPETGPTSLGIVVGVGNIDVCHLIGA
jgi:hypothetical protein